MKNKTSIILIFLFLTSSLFIGCVNVPGSNIPVNPAMIPSEQNEDVIDMSYDAIAVWQEKGEEDKDWNIYYSVYSEDKDSWFNFETSTASAPISKLNGDDYDPDIATNPEESIAVAVWSNQEKHNIFLSVFNGKKWSEPYEITLNGDDYDPTVALGRDGAFIAWVNEKDGKRKLYYVFYTLSALKKSSFDSQPKELELNLQVALPEAESFGNSFALVFAAKGNCSFPMIVLFRNASQVYLSSIPGDNSVIFDTSNPAYQRIGISSDASSLHIVWSGTKGVYYFNYPSSSSSDLLDREYTPDVQAPLVSGKPVILYTKDNESYLYDYYLDEKIDAYLKDLRPSLTLLLSGKVLSVFYSKNATESKIFYSVLSSSWKKPKELDGSSYARNPAVDYWYQYSEPEKNNTAAFCGNSKLEGSEECEVGIPCKGKNQVCFACVCLNTSFCGNSKLEGSEECEVGIPCKGKNELCDISSCECKEVEELPPLHICGDGIVDPGEQCELGIPCKNTNEICDLSSCTCFSLGIGKKGNHPETPYPGDNEGKVNSNKSSNATANASYNASSEGVEVSDAEEIYCSDTIKTMVPGEGHYYVCIDDCPAGYYCNEKTCECIGRDTDEDGIIDVKDNCPTTYNPDQEDMDNDGIGDECDSCPEDPGNDLDKDGVCAAEDNCPEVYNPEQEDDDLDNIGDYCDPTPINCENVASQYKGAVVVAENVDPQTCANLVAEHFDSRECTTTCRFAYLKTYTWYYKGDIVNEYNCCLGAVTYLDCQDCPGQNPLCPSQYECDEYNPFPQSS